METSKFGLLRNIKADELELMLSWRNAPSVRANMYTRHEISHSEHMTWWKKTKNREDQKYFMYENNKIPLGIIGFTSIDTVNINATWAFYSSPQAPKGTGIKMELLSLDYAFDNLLLHKLNCEVLSFNQPVINLHQKFNFKIEGIFREHHKIDETFVDIYRLGILKSEWKEHRHLMLEKLSNTLKNNLNLRNNEGIKNHEY